MSLVENAPWTGEITDAVPVRLEPETIVLPDNTELTFLGIEHGDESNADYLNELLRDSDIFFPEINSWDPLTAKILQKVSNGDYDARQRMLQGSRSSFMGFVGQLVAGMYNTKVTVCMADLPRTSPIPNKLAKLAYRDGLVNSAFPLMAERDKHIAHTIGSEIIRVKGEKTRLNDRLVKATALFGVGHISVESALREAARLQDESTFTTRLLLDQDAANNRPQDVIDYANWLRTPDTVA